MNKLTSLAVAVIATSSMLSAAQAVTVTPNFGGYVRAGLIMLSTVNTTHGIKIK